MKKTIFTILAAVICSALLAQEIPLKISYQGKLLENGSPVNGTKSILFTIGSWSETKTVTVTDGLYSVTLGDFTPIPVSTFNNSSTTTLQITVAGSPLNPQTDILSVPYSYKAEKSVDAEQIASRTVSTTAPTSGQVLKWNSTQWAPSTDNTGISSETDPQVGSNTLNYAPLWDGSALITSPIYSANSNVSIGTTSTSNGKLNIYASNTTGLDIQAYNYGITVESTNSSDDAIYAKNTSGGRAGYFLGNVQIQGTLSKSSGSFLIDHPLDPENKYLFHSFVESPDMMNVYNGNITLNNNGDAIVELPEWFDTLNKDFRYQLTCIGGFAPIYIAEKISDNQFKIAGGTPGLEVSWQVTGIRKDPYAEQHRIQVEVKKSDNEKGHYLHYKEYNQPIEKSIEAVKNPEILQEVKSK
ncbi:MAG: hypothetical protein HY841_09700 [Bacteroidetes bacterium]|nr:hypothetical protein [Bacteroidota bacterium]